MTISIVSCGGNETQPIVKEKPSPKEILEGKWTGVLTFVESLPNTCSARTDITKTHNITVNDRAIRLEELNGAIHEGTLIGDNEFDVKFFQVGASAEISNIISYRNVANGRADVVVTLSEYSFGKGCSRKWMGVMIR